MFKVIKSLSSLLGLVLALLVSAPAFALFEEAGDNANLFRQLHEYAQLANASYQAKTEIEKTLLTSGYKLTEHGTLPGYGVSYYIATSDDKKQQILSVRGTSNIENAVVDVAIELLPDKHTGIKLHQGFAQAARQIYDQIKPRLISEYQINTTGHSLGGAVALIIAMYLEVDDFNVGKIVTFGQPKVTNISGSREFNHLDITRVVMPRDVVPLVPPFDPMDVQKLDIYWHSGTEIVLQQGNTFSELEGLASMMRATDFLNEAVTDKNLQQHYMSVYLDSIKLKLDSPRAVPYENNFSIYDLFGGNKSVNDQK